MVKWLIAYKWGVFDQISDVDSDLLIFIRFVHGPFFYEIIEIGIVDRNGEMLFLVANF